MPFSLHMLFFIRISSILLMLNQCHLEGLLCTGEVQQTTFPDRLLRLQERFGREELYGYKSIKLRGYACSRCTNAIFYGHWIDWEI